MKIAITTKLIVLSVAFALTGSTAGAGILFTKFGFPHVLAAIAALAVVAAMLFRRLADDSEHASSSLSRIA